MDHEIRKEGGGYFEKSESPIIKDKSNKVHEISTPSTA